MNIEAFLAILTACAIVTSLMTEAIKKFLDSINVKYVTNVLVLIVSIVVGGAIGFVCCVKELYVIDYRTIFIIALIVANWLVAMLGYDKIVQTITQFKNAEE